MAFLSKRVMLKNVTLNFPEVFVAKGFQDSEPKFSSVIILKEGTPAYKQAKDAVSALHNQYQNEGGKKIQDHMITLKEGNPEFVSEKDALVFKASSKKRIPVINRDKTPIVQEDDLIYSGVIVNASVEFWIQDNQFGKRINCFLNGIQRVSDGIRMGGSSIDAVDEFEELDELGEEFDI